MASEAVNAQRNGFGYFPGRGIYRTYDVLDAEGYIIDTRTAMECLLVYGILIYERGQLN